MRVCRSHEGHCLSWSFEEQMQVGSSDEPEGIIVRPLDDIFGAGEVNVYNSYRILYAGEFDGSSEDQVSKMSGLFGWDYGESIEPGKPLNGPSN